MSYSLFSRLQLMLTEILPLFDFTTNEKYKTKVKNVIFLTTILCLLYEINYLMASQYPGQTLFMVLTQPG